MRLSLKGLFKLKTFLGFLVLLAGVLPLLAEQELLPEVLTFIPTSGLGYQLIIIILGAVIMFHGIKSY